MDEATDIGEGYYCQCGNPNGEGVHTSHGCGKPREVAQQLSTALEVSASQVSHLQVRTKHLESERRERQLDALFAQWVLCFACEVHVTESYEDGLTLSVSFCPQHSNLFAASQVNDANVNF